MTERGDEGAAYIMNMTNGLGADSVLERVGTQESMQQAIRSARPGGYVGYVGVPRGHARRTGAVLRARPTARRPRAGAPFPARADRPGVEREDQPWQVFDLTLPLDRVAEGYRAMDERRAIKALLRP